MPAWVFEDDCAAPERRTKIDYTGPNPFKVCLIIRSLLEKIYEVEAVDLWERDFRWDTTSDPRGFFMRMYVSKGVDAHTRMFIEVVIQGAQPSDPTKNGKVTIYINGKLRTAYELDTVFKRLPIYKAIRWLYNMIFYSEVRRGYIRLCNQLNEQLGREIREALGMPVPEKVL
jgi:hypothetical protein